MTTSRTLATALAAGGLTITILGATVSAGLQQKPAKAAGSSSSTARAGVDEEPWPRTITSGDTTITIHQPQIDVIRTDRRISYWEARNQPRTIDYPFTLIEMRLDKDGNGEGRMAVGTKISRSEDGKTIELENYGISPVALKNMAIAR